MGSWVGWDPSDDKCPGDPEASRAGKEFHCWYFTMVFCACASALGFQARSLAVGKGNTDFIPPEEINISHVTAEICSNDHGKWIVMDEEEELRHLQAHATSLAFGQPGMPAVEWADEYSPPQIYMGNCRFRPTCNSLPA